MSDPFELENTWPQASQEKRYESRVKPKAWRLKPWMWAVIASTLGLVYLYLMNFFTDSSGSATDSVREELFLTFFSVIIPVVAILGVVLTKDSYERYKGFQFYFAGMVGVAFSSFGFFKSRSFFDFVTFFCLAALALMGGIWTEKKVIRHEEESVRRVVEPPPSVYRQPPHDETEERSCDMNKNSALNASNVLPKYEGERIDRNNGPVNCQKRMSPIMWAAVPPVSMLFIGLIVYLIGLLTPIGENEGAIVLVFLGLYAMNASCLITSLLGLIRGMVWYGGNKGSGWYMCGMLIMAISSAVTFTIPPIGFPFVLVGWAIAGMGGSAMEKGSVSEAHYGNER